MELNFGEPISVSRTSLTQLINLRQAVQSREFLKLAMQVGRKGATVDCDIPDTTKPSAMNICIHK